MKNEQIGECFIWIDSAGNKQEVQWKLSNDSYEDGTDETIYEAIDNGWTIPVWSDKSRREETYWKWDKKIRMRIRGVFNFWKDFREKPGTVGNRQTT
jgi:hypothetical protein